MKCAITAQSAQTAQSHLGNNKTLAQLKVCIVMSIHNMEKIEQSSEPQKIPDLCFAQNLVETYNMSVVIYISQLLV